MVFHDESAIGSVGAAMAAMPDQEACGDQTRPHQLQAILDRLDATSAGEPERQLRGCARVTFRRTNVRVDVYHPGGSATIRRVTTRDLSAGGISFILNGYLHTGTRVRVLLTNNAGLEVPITGRVVRCTHAQGAWHSVGVKFDRRVDCDAFLDGERIRQLRQQSQSTGQLQGQLLFIDDMAAEHQLLAHHLRGTSIELTCCRSPLAAREILRSRRFDLVISELSFPGEESDADWTGTRLVNFLRACGHEERVIICTAEASKAMLGALAQIDGASVLRKPYSGPTLLRCLDAWLSADAVQEPLVSELAGNAEMTPVLEQYCEHVRRLAAELAIAASAKHVDRCRIICLQLQGSGGSFGFDRLSETSGRALDVLDAARDVDVAAKQLEEVRLVCLQIVPFARPEVSHRIIV